MPKDKVLHVIVGFVISFFGGLALGPGLGFGLACLAGAAKEADDKYSGKGTPEWLDFLATAASGFIGAGITILMRA